MERLLAIAEGRCRCFAPPSTDSSAVAGDCMHEECHGDYVTPNMARRRSMYCACPLVIQGGSASSPGQAC